MSDAIEAACRAYLLERDIDPDYPHGLKPGAEVWWKTEVPAITAAITAYEAARGGGVGVKPLEWKLSNVASRWSAKHAFGTYEIARDHRANSETTHGWFSNGQWLWVSSLEAAKSAAQADYESRIRSALTSPASGSGTREEIKGAVGRETEGWPAETDHVPSPASGERDAATASDESGE